MPTSHISSSLFASFSQHKALQAPQPTPSPTLPTLEEDKPAGTPSLLPGKQGRTGHSPPGQARHGHHPHTTLLQGKQDTATIRTPPFLPGKQQPDQESPKFPPLLSSRASKDTRAIFLQGGQGLAAKPPPGQARPRTPDPPPGPART